MSSLKQYQRDRELPGALGDAQLTLPQDEELKSLVAQVVVRCHDQIVGARPRVANSGRIATRVSSLYKVGSQMKRGLNSDHAFTPRQQLQPCQEW